jgi:hypothetical protein
MNPHSIKQIELDKIHTKATQKKTQKVRKVKDREQEAYEYLMEAIAYRKRILQEVISSNYLPNNLREEYQEKMEYINRLGEMMF